MEVAQLPSLGTADTERVPDRVRKLLPEYLPTSDTAREAKAKLIRNSALWRVQLEDEDMVGLIPLNEELSKDEEARKRYLRSWKSSPKFMKLGPRWGPAISLAVRGLRTFRKWVDILRISEFKTATGLMKCFKSLTTNAKKFGPLFEEDWHELINGETLGGYLTDVPPCTLR